MGMESLKQFTSLWPEEAGTESGGLAVCASGRTIWDDLARIPGFKGSWQQNFDIMAVNDTGMHIPYRLKHWYSNDKWLLRWRPARRERFGENDTTNENIKLHSCFGIDGAVNWGWPGGGTSTLNAVMTGLALGYDRIYICGAPLDNSGHYFDPPWVTTNFSRSGGLREWESRKPYFEGKVVSMSGNTKEILNA